LECNAGEFWAIIVNWLILSLILGIGFSWLTLPYSRDQLDLRGWAQFRYFIKASLLIGLVGVLVMILIYEVQYC
jgi:hypothetical protein